MTMKIVHIVKTVSLEKVKPEEVTVPDICVCKRCTHSWKPHDKLPRVCPRCRSKYWSSEKVHLDCIRCNYKWVQKKSCVPKECPKCGSDNWNAPELRELDDCIAWLEREIERQGSLKVRLPRLVRLPRFTGVVLLTPEAKSKAKPRERQRTGKIASEPSEVSESPTSPSSPTSPVGLFTSTLKKQKSHTQGKQNHA